MRNIRTLAWLITLCLAACDARPVDPDPVALDPCGAVADVALQKQILQLLVGGAMSEKLDPKVMPEGGLVNITDAYRAKSGELRARTGWARMTKATDSGANLAACRALFPLQGGNLGLIGSLASPGTADALYEYSKTENKWMHNTRGYQPMPMAVTTLAPVESRNISTATLSNLASGDYAVAGSVAMTGFTDQGGAGLAANVITDVATGTVLRGLTSSGVNGPTHRVAAGGSTFLVQFVIDTTAFPGTLRAVVVNAATLASSTFAVTGAVVGSAIAFDVKSLANGNILVAYSPNAGGVTALEFNPATGGIVNGPTNFALGGGFNSCAWLDDGFGTGSYHLAVGDSVGGVNVIKMSTALVFQLTTAIDGAATNIEGITGYLSSAAPNYSVLYFDNSVTGALRNSGVTIAKAIHLFSKSFAVAGKHYVIAGWDYSPTGVQAVQPTAFVIATDTVGQDLTGGSRIAGIVMPGTAGGMQLRTKLITSMVVSGSIASGALSKITKQSKTTVSTTHQIVLASVNFSPKLRNARELSGTVFFPGGMVTQFDGASVDLATFPLFPEIASASTAAPGSMTPSGVYQYVAVYKTIDSYGRIRRSAPSIPLQVTLGAGDHSANVNITTLSIGVVASGAGPVTSPGIEVYRAGPAAAGGIVYNKVGEIASDYTVDRVTFNDTVSDTIAAGLELLYDPLANGGVLNNFPSPSTQLLEVLDNRVFVVSAENPTEIWPSKEYKTGAGLAFNPNLVQRFTGSPITALAAMDGRLVVFQNATTWVWPIGPGPNDQGQGTFGDPQLVSLNIGCINPDSVVATPDGIMFQAAQGFYLLTRGLEMQFVGDAVEDKTASINGGGGFAGAALAPSLNQVRILGAGLAGSTLVYDWYFKQWFEWGLPIGGNPFVGMAAAGGGSYYADNSGQVYQETTNAFDLANATAIFWSFTLPPLAVGQIGGWFLSYAVKITGTYEGQHILSIANGLSYGEASDSGSITVTSVPSPPASYQFERRLRKQKATSIQPVVSVIPIGASEGARISALSLVYGGKPGRFPLPANRRMT